MSVTASIDLHGNFRGTDHIRSIVEFLRGENVTIVFDGVIRANIDNGDGWEYCEISPGIEDPFCVIYNKLKDGKIAGIYMTMNIIDSDQYLLMHASKNTLTVLIEGNRKTIDGYHTDYSWYFLNFISNIRNKLMSTYELCYRDMY